MTREEFQREAIRGGQPFKVAKANGISVPSARRWYREAVKAEEVSGGLGTWSKEDIEVELSLLRALGRKHFRKERVGDLTHFAVLDEDDFVEVSPTSYGPTRWVMSHYRQIPRADEYDFLEAV